MTGLVCDLAVLLVDVDAAAISLRVCEGCEELVAASDPWAQALEELQYTLGEGPGVEALVALRLVTVTDVRVDGGRWPGFATSAAADGLVSVFAFPIDPAGTRLGTLDLYRRRSGELSTEQLTDAAMLADMAMFTLMGDIGSDENLGGVRDGTAWSLRRGAHGHGHARCPPGDQRRRSLCATTGSCVRYRSDTA